MIDLFFFPLITLILFFTNNFLECIMALQVITTHLRRGRVFKKQPERKQSPKKKKKPFSRHSKEQALAGFDFFLLLLLFISTILFFYILVSLFLWKSNALRGTTGSVNGSIGREIRWHGYGFFFLLVKHTQLNSEDTNTHTNYGVYVHIILYIHLCLKKW